MSEHPRPVDAPPPTLPAQNGWRFWLTLFSVALTFFICSFDFTAVAVALPTLSAIFFPISYAWVVLGYVLSATAFIPISAGLAQAIGRRWTFFLSLSLFILGSGIASVWNTLETLETLVAARVPQGLGAGGMQTVAAIILNDHIPLQDRNRCSPFFALVLVIPYLVGPIVAAAFLNGSSSNGSAMEWIFLVNVPVAALLLLLLIGFDKTPIPRPSSRVKVFARIDWIGNLLAIGGTASFVTGLVCGGAFFPWYSYQVIVPLVIGILGLIAFVPWEIYGAAEPILPVAAFTNRTTISGYFQTFCASLVTYAVIYFVPVYYGACIDASSDEIGTYMLGFGAIVPATAAAWCFIYLKRLYRPVIWFGWSFVVVGVALLAKAKTGESPDHVIGVSALIGVGLGFLFVSTVHAVQAPVAAHQHAQALIFYVYLRTLSGVWGIAIAAAVLQNEIKPRIPREVFDFSWQQNSAWAYGYSATPRWIQDWGMHSQVQTAYKGSLQLVWAAIGAIAAVGLLSSFSMKAVPLPEHTQGGWMMMQCRDEKGPMSEKIEDLRQTV
ncbi:major facilitator superfamily domain-containing protein [Fomes fomentarius]|nr:major facilitator superfamily domain-containing protein [Fomes fomentarius]